MIKMNFLLALHCKKNTGLSISYYLKKHIIYFLKVNNVGLSLPVTGCAGIFSTSGVLDSAGSAKVSFLAKKVRKQTIYLTSS